MTSSEVSRAFLCFQWTLAQPTNVISKFVQFNNWIICTLTSLIFWRRSFVLLFTFQMTQFTSHFRSYNFHRNSLIIFCIQWSFDNCENISHRFNRDDNIRNESSKSQSYFSTDMKLHVFLLVLLIFISALLSSSSSSSTKQQTEENI